MSNVGVFTRYKLRVHGIEPRKRKVTGKDFIVMDVPGEAVTAEENAKNRATALEQAPKTLKAALYEGVFRQFHSVTLSEHHCEGRQSDGFGLMVSEDIFGSRAGGKFGTWAPAIPTPEQAAKAAFDLKFPKPVAQVTK